VSHGADEVVQVLAPLGVVGCKPGQHPGDVGGGAVGVLAFGPIHVLDIGQPHRLPGPVHRILVHVVRLVPLKVAGPGRASRQGCQPALVHGGVVQLVDEDDARERPQERGGVPGAAAREAAPDR
jgi:hypothetical protein